MMNGILISPPEKIDVSIHLPASKSICNRALIIQALSQGTHHINNLSDCIDTSVMIKALHDMPEVIDINAAGTAMRFLTAYLSTIPSKHILTGTDRMKQRPIGILVDALNSIGAHIEYSEKKGFPPLKITGTLLEGGEITLDGSISSQYISALLMIAPTLQKGLILHLKGEIVSRSYINLTIQLMKEFGADVHWDSGTCIIVNPTSYHNIPYSVESDWSAASYWYEITALMPKTIIRLSELKEKSYQGDKRVTDVFDRLGVQTDFTDEGVIIRHTEHKTNMFTDNFSDIPDLAQTVIVTCCLLHVPFRIDGLRTLKIKETDRIEALKKELFKLGYIINDENGGDVLSGDGKQFPIDNVPIIETYEDHRMAMAFAPTSIITSNVQINNPIVVNKSYVEYWSDLRKAGFTIKTI